MSANRPAVFLDRDGVLNEVVVVDGSPTSPRTVDELHVVGNARVLLDALRNAGYTPIVVTNQPEIARGGITEAAVHAMHAELERVLPIEAVYVCPHDTAARCSCRKPAPGMLLTAAREHALDLALSWLVGDRWVDIAAARDGGVRSVLIDRPWSWEPTSSGEAPDGLRPDARVSDLSSAVATILAADVQKS